MTIPDKHMKILELRSRMSSKRRSGKNAQSKDREQVKPEPDDLVTSGFLDGSTSIGLIAIIPVISETSECVWSSMKDVYDCVNRLHGLEVRNVLRPSLACREKSISQWVGWWRSMGGGMVPR